MSSARYIVNDWLLVKLMTIIRRKLPLVKKKNELRMKSIKILKYINRLFSEDQSVSINGAVSSLISIGIG